MLDDHDIKYHYRIRHYRNDQVYRTERVAFSDRDKENDTTGPRHALQRYMQVWNTKVGDVLEVEYIGTPLRFEIKLERVVEGRE